jgi:hypothetical protein
MLKSNFHATPNHTYIFMFFLEKIKQALCMACRHTGGEEGG